MKRRNNQLRFFVPVAEAKRNIAIIYRLGMELKTDNILIHQIHVPVAANLQHYAVQTDCPHPTTIALRPFFRERRTHGIGSSIYRIMKWSRSA